MIERNTKHFNQAHGTPFTKGGLFELLGWSGTGPAAEKVLAGTLDIDSLETTEAVKAILRGLQRRDNFQAIDTHITNDDFMKGFKRWDE